MKRDKLREEGEADTRQMDLPHHDTWRSCSRDVKKAEVGAGRDRGLMNRVEDCVMWGRVEIMRLPMTMPGLV